MKKSSGANDGLDPPLEVVDSYWPPLSECPKCYSTTLTLGLGDNTNTEHQEATDGRSSISWNLEEVFEQLKHKYWPRALQSPRVVVLDRWDSKQLDILHPGHGYLGNSMALITVLLACGFAFRFFYTSKLQRLKFVRNKREVRE